MGCIKSKQDLPQKDLDFLKAYTCFDENVILVWYSNFMQDCPYGELTQDKFLELNGLFFPSYFYAEKFCEHFFTTFDTDLNGYLDFKEYLLAINKINAETPEDKLKVAFRILDLNGNGKLSFSEMTNFIEVIFKMPLVDDTTMKNAVIESAKNIFLKMGKNEYEFLTEKEFVEICLQDDLLLQNMLLQSTFLDNIAIKKKTFQRSLGEYTFQSKLID